MSDGLLVVIILLILIGLPLIIYLPLGGIAFISEKIKAYQFKNMGTVTMSAGDSTLVPQNLVKAQLYPDRAEFSRRFGAFFIDTFMINVPLRLLHLLVVTFTQVYQPINMVLLVSDLFLPVGLYWWYFSYYCYKNNGQTLGQKWNKIRVASKDGGIPR